MDAVARSIATVPVDDEPLTEEEDRALDRAEALLNGTAVRVSLTRTS
jgi:hypothetical protein